MFNINIFFIFLYSLSFINIVLTNSSPLILQFETQKASVSINPDNYFELKYNNELKVNIKAGTHRQSIPCYLNINTHTFYISGSNSKLINSQPKYEEFKSTKYQNTSDKITYESFYVYGMPSKDEICLNNDNRVELEFYLAQSKFSSSELTHSCILGLGYEQVPFDENKENYVDGIESFITQIKNNNIINQKIFFINYNNNDNGDIIFGAFPHELNGNYYGFFTEENYVEMDNSFINDIEIIWSSKGYIYVGENKLFDYLSTIEFELSQGFIIGSYNYKQNIENNFFNEKISKNECFKREIFVDKEAFEGFYCKKNVDITKIEDLIILIDKIQYKIEFTYKDLFTELDGYLYFDVLFTQEQDTFKNDFTLGKPFFKKYPMIFNTKERVEKIGFYNDFLEQKNRGQNDSTKKDSNSGKVSKLGIFLIIIGICIIGLLVYISIKYFNRPRKQKVNELIEFFDYSSTQNKI